MIRSRVVDADASFGGDLSALLLAGSLRTSRTAPLAAELGLPVASLPVDAASSVLSWWLDALLGQRTVRGVAVALADPSERSFYERIAVEAGYNDGRFAVWVDRNQHRGAGGTVRDYFADLTAQRESRGEPCGAVGLLVAECSSFGGFDLSAFVAAIDPDAEATVLATPEGRPCGVIHLSPRAIQRIPAIGYFDLKEQLLPAIAAAGGRVPIVRSLVRPHRISDRASYLSLVALWRAAGTPMTSDAATVDPTAYLEGGTLVGRGASIRARAIVSDSVVMPGAIVEMGAVVARSVVPPGARVPSGARVTDEVFAPLAGAGRDER